MNIAKKASSIPKSNLWGIAKFKSVNTFHNHVQANRQFYDVLNPFLQSPQKPQAQLEREKLMPLSEVPAYKNEPFPDEKTAGMMWLFAVRAHQFSNFPINIFKLLQYAVRKGYFAVINWHKNTNQRPFLPILESLLEPLDPKKINYFLGLGLNIKSDYANQAMEKSLQLLEHYREHPKEQVAAAGAVVLQVLNKFSELQKSNNLSRLMKVAHIINHPEIKKFEALFLKFQLEKICSYKIFFLGDQEKLIRTIIKVLNEIFISQRPITDIIWIKSRIERESHANAGNLSGKLLKMLQGLEAQNIWIFHGGL